MCNFCAAFRSSRRRLTGRLAARFGPRQVAWKNPDLVSRGVFGPHQLGTCTLATTCLILGRFGLEQNPTAAFPPQLLGTPPSLVENQNVVDQPSSLVGIRRPRCRRLFIL